MQRARIEAEAAIAKLETRVKVEVAGQFGEKKFLTTLERLIADKPFDIVNFRMDVPTLKGHLQGSPGFMSFELTSENMEQVSDIMADLRGLIEVNQLILVSESRIS